MQQASGYNNAAPGPPPPAVPMTRVTLGVSAKNLTDRDVTSRSDPVCILYCQEPGSSALHELGRTEKIKDSLDPLWVTKFEIDYQFERRQVLQFHVFDWDDNKYDHTSQDKLGWTEVTLAEIMASGGTPLSRTLTDGKKGMLLIYGEEMAQSKEVVTLSLAASGLDKKDTFGKSDPFLIIHRAVGDNNHYSAVHRTEYLRKTLNPVWKPIIIPANMLCGGYSERSLKLECYDWDSDGTHDFIGECFTTLAELKQGTNKTFLLINPKKKAKKSSYRDSGKLIVQACRVHEEPTFLDYIRGGTQLHFTVAVDFTASNGDPRQPTSLHFMHPQWENQYAAAIRAVGEIIQDYDFDKQFPALGFGGKIPPDYKVSHEFFLNGRADTPYCSGVQGILDAYRHSLATVGLYGPTNFAPIINHVAQFARQMPDGKNYFVLLIITDGIISDLVKTKQALVAASVLPMSVIIIGVGNENFEAMGELDGDDRRVSHNGQYAVRDIVQFVELRRHLQALASSPLLGRSLLAKDVLAEIPQQVVSWMKANRMTPGNSAAEVPAAVRDLQGLAL